MDNNQDVEYLADLFYLALEAECAVCSNRLSDAQGSTELAMRSWADRVAKAAHLDGWRVQDHQPVCMVCFQSKSAKRMSTSRVKTRKGWSLIPGPAILTHPMNSQDVHEITIQSSERITESILSFPGMRLIRPQTPSWSEWLARWEYGTDFMDIEVTLFEDEEKSWGGSPITADCRMDTLEDLWSHLQSRHAGIWLHGPDCTIHTHESLRRTSGE